MSRILVIEDEGELRDLIAQFLGFHDHEVLKAANGREGLEMARAEQPELIVSDVMMPLMDGFEVLEHLRQDAKTADIPFLFLTAKADRRDMRKGMELGADDYLTKPFEAPELIEAVERRLRRHQSFVSRRQAVIDELHEGLSRMLPDELRNPLSAIIGYSGMLRDGWAGFAPQEIRRMLDQICGAGARLERLVESYSTYARLLDSRRGGQGEPVESISGAAGASVAQMVAERLIGGSPRKHDVELALAEGEIPMETEDFVNLITALLDNALQRSEVGQKVRLSGEPAESGYRLKMSEIDLGPNGETNISLAVARMLAEQTGGALCMDPDPVAASGEAGSEVHILLGPLTRP